MTIVLQPPKPIKNKDLEAVELPVTRKGECSEALVDATMKAFSEKGYNISIPFSDVECKEFKDSLLRTIIQWALKHGDPQISVRIMTNEGLAEIINCTQK